MTITGSGEISLNDIKTELSSSNDNLRAYAASASFSAPDSFSEFYGYEHFLYKGTLTVGSWPTFGLNIAYGFSDNEEIGSISPTGFKTTDITELYWAGNVLYLNFDSVTLPTFGKLVINSTSFSSGGFNEGLDGYTKSGVTTNPFGTTTGATRTIRISA